MLRTLKLLLMLLTMPLIMLGFDMFLYNEDEEVY